jgi:ABC-type lipoprotein export system ATPase subunit
MTDIALSCTHIARRFSSRGKITDVLRDVSLTVREGQIVVIQGRSGSGKSTLLQLLAGLDRPTAGSVEIAGRPLGDLSAGELAVLRRQTIGFIFQSFNLIPSWTAGQNVEAALIHTTLSRPVRKQKAREILEKLELGERIDHLPSELSVGQQQRVAVARALIHGPAIVFADEPTGDVDPETARAIMDCLVGLVRGNRTTFIVCTHGEFAVEAADQNYLLQDGSIAPISYQSNQPKGQK